MTLQEAKTIVREACIKANPEIIINKNAQLIGFDHKVTYFEQSRPIRLADVLLAILNGSNAITPIELNGDKTVTLYADNPEIVGEDENHWCDWNLLKDDLSQQSEATMVFLAGLLGSNT